MRRTAWCMAGVVIAAAAAPATAQPQRRGMPTMSPLMLLSNKDVQKDVNLTADQVKKVNKETNYQRLARQELRDLEEKKRDKRAEELNRESDEFLAKVLTPEQAKRLRQISLQVDGPQSFGKPDVAKELALSEEQKQTVMEIQGDMVKKIQAMLELRGDREEAMKKRSEILRSANEKMKGLLTAEQKAKWKEMTGEPFKGEIRFGGGRTAGSGSDRRP